MSIPASDSFDKIKINAERCKLAWIASRAKMGPLNFRGTEVVNVPRWPSEWASPLLELELKSGKRTG